MCVPRRSFRGHGAHRQGLTVAEADACGDDYRACGAATTSISIIAPGQDERLDLDERACRRLRPEVLAPDLANRGQVIERGHVGPHLHDVGERRALASRMMRRFSKTWASALHVAGAHQRSIDLREPP